jgi:DNA/RNA endonuclease YhcR with UshA esterase domain
MKKIKGLLFVIMIITAATSFNVLKAQETPKQENQKPDKEREEELQQAINEQKKAMSEQKRARARASQEINESMKELEKMKGMNFKFEFSDDSTHWEGPRSRSIGRTYTMRSFPDPVFFGHVFEGDGESTTWEFTKSVKDNSIKKDYAFDVEKTAKSVVLSVNGDCRAGEIRIKILTPAGKNYSDTVIDEAGNINIRKSFNITETENQDKTGEWKIQVSSEKATGFFKISFQVY